METMISEVEVTSSPPDQPRLDGKALEGLRTLEELARTMEPETELPDTILITEIEILPVFHHRERSSPAGQSFPCKNNLISVPVSEGRATNLDDHETDLSRTGL